MELKEFIKGTITDIALAIKELNEENKNSGLLINPTGCHCLSKELAEIGDGRLVKDVEFNLSIDTSDATGPDKNLKINVLKVVISNATNNNTVSTIKFSIPVVFPGCDSPRGYDTWNQ